jgi:hypothetical protein
MENSGMSKGEEGTEEERRSEVTDDNEDMIKIEELNKALNSSVINDPLGEPGHTPLYVGLPSTWGSVDGDQMFSRFSWEGSLLGTLTDINE